MATSCKYLGGRRHAKKHRAKKHRAKKHSTKKHSTKRHTAKRNRRRSRTTSRARGGMERDAADLSSLFGNLGLGTAQAVGQASRGVLGATQGVGKASSSLALGAARGTAQLGVDVGNTFVPQFVPGRNAFSMGSLSRRMSVDAREGTRKSTRTRTAPRRLSPERITKSKSKSRSTSQKAATLKAKRTRALNTSRGFKTTADRRRAAAKKGQATKKTNLRFTSAAKDMRAALDDLL